MLFCPVLLILKGKIHYSGKISLLSKFRDSWPVMVMANVFVGRGGRAASHEDGGRGDLAASKLVRSPIGAVLLIVRPSFMT